MAESENQLEEKLTEVGNKLIDSSSSIDQLLPLLDQAEIILSKVEQSPSKLMLKALSPSLGALVSEKLFRHPNVDVKVAVASCICEITRITAPEAPYDDDQMKEVFQLIVSSLENLHDKSSSSYDKRISILETVAKVRSCVVMLDLECEGLIVEMFQHFLKEIRDHHSENVFSSMETIMTLVLEESEDISVELLSPILSSIRTDNEGVLPIARQLVERVLENSATKVRPYVIEAMNTLGRSLHNYSKVVASICQDTSGVKELNDTATEEHLADRSNSISAPAGEFVEGQKEIAIEAAHFEQVSAPNDGSLKSAVANGQTKVVSLADSDTKEHGELADQSNNVDTSSNAEPDVLEAEKLVVHSGLEEEQIVTERARKSNSQKTTDSSDTFHVDGIMVDEAVRDGKGGGKDVPGFSREDNHVEVVISSENKQETDVLSTLPKAMEDDSGDIASTSAGETVIANLKHSKNASRRKRTVKKAKLLKEVTPSYEDISKKALEGDHDSEAKPSKKYGKKVASRASNQEKTPTPTDETKKVNKDTSESEAKEMEQSSERLDTGGNIMEGSSKLTEDTKKRSRGNAIFGKEMSKASIRDKIFGKKVASRASNQEKTPTPTDESKKVNKATSESEANEMEQSSERLDAGGNIMEGSSKLTEDTKKRNRGNTIFGKEMSKASIKDNDKETISSRKSRKLREDNHRLGETPKTMLKTKQTQGKEQEPEFYKNILGTRIRVWWPHDKSFYTGVVHSYDSAKRRHLVLYDDGEQELLILKKERWELVEGGDSKSDEEEGAEQKRVDGLSEMAPKKSAKTNVDQSTRKDKSNTLPKGGIGASPSKSKAAATKSGSKSKEVDKVQSKSKDFLKSDSKSDNEGVGKSQEKKSSRKSNTPTKSASQSKVDDTIAPEFGKSKQGPAKAITKSKQEPLKSCSRRMDKRARSDDQSGIDKGAKKEKSGSSKPIEESDDEGSSKSAEASKILKRKTPVSSKEQGSSAKSEKKRRR